MSKVSIVKQAAYGRWHEIFKALTEKLDDAVKSCPNHVPCPVAGGTDGFRLFKDSNNCGSGVSNQDGVMSGGFDVLIWVLDKDFTFVLNEVADYLGLSENQWKCRIESTETKKLATVTTDHEALKRCRYALRKAWMNAVDLTEPEANIARAYLASRGLELTKIDLCGMSKTMRFNPALELYEKRKFVGKFPALVTLVSYADGKAATIHRTYLDANGNKLARVIDGNAIKAKKLMSRCEDRYLTGGSIQFGEAKGNILHLAEGIETTLSVKQVLTTRHAVDEPVWCTVSSTLLAKFNPPKGVTQLFVWADKDRIRYNNGKKIEVGLDAAMEVAKRMEERNVCVYIMYPQGEIPNECKSVDWNDVLVNKGEQAFPNYHNQIWGMAS